MPGAVQFLTPQRAGHSAGVLRCTLRSCGWTGQGKVQPDAAAQRSSAVQSWPLLCARSNGLILPSTEKQGIKLKYCAALKRESRAGRDSRFILSK